MRCPWAKAILGAMLAALLGVQGYLVIDYLDEEQYLVRQMNQIALPTLSPSEQVLKVLVALKGKPDIDNLSYCLLPAFQFLRATPRQVFEQGGECGDRSRLLIRLLRVRGIQATKWALYGKDGEAHHAVVEVKSEVGDMAVDPLYGLVFTRRGGGYYGIRDLKASDMILRERVQSLIAQGVQPGTSDLRTYPLDEYRYSDAKTFNWSKWRGLQLLYRVLRSVVGPSIESLERPFWVEIPQLMIIFLIGAMQIVLSIFYWRWSIR